MPAFDRVALVGGGQQGAQLAIVCAVHGIAVTVIDLPDALAGVHRRLAETASAYSRQSPAIAPAAIDAALQRIRTTAGLADGLAAAGLVIESVPEDLDLKLGLWPQIARAAAPHAVLATNTSGFLPSELIEGVDHPERFLALHFAQSVWLQSIGEVMPHPGTDPDVQDRVAEFLGDIEVEPVRMHAENRGYLMNAMLIPFLNAAGALLMRGLADAATIDETWRVSTNARYGPFELIDMAGLRTAHAMAVASGDARAALFATYLQENYLDHGRYGVESGEGFHRWPTPSSSEIDDEFESGSRP